MWSIQIQPRVVTPGVYNIKGPCSVQIEDHTHYSLFLTDKSPHMGKIINKDIAKVYIIAVLKHVWDQVIKY